MQNFTKLIFTVLLISRCITCITFIVFYLTYFKKYIKQNTRNYILIKMLKLNFDFLLYSRWDLGGKYIRVKFKTKIQKSNAKIP